MEGVKEVCKAKMAPAHTVRLHTLKLHESPVVGGNDYQRFSHAWLLDDPNGVVAPGDVVSFPELLTGAGEFEGMRFACRPDGESSDARPLQLVDGGIEMVSFPAAIAALVEGEMAAGGPSFRERYHAVFDRLLEQQGFSMEVMCEGCDGGSDAFWSDVEAGHSSNPRRPAEEVTWVIPLARCELVSTEEFQCSRL